MSCNNSSEGTCGMESRRLMRVCDTIIFVVVEDGCVNDVKCDWACELQLIG